LRGLLGSPSQARAPAATVGKAAVPADPRRADTSVRFRDRRLPAGASLATCAHTRLPTVRERRVVVPSRVATPAGRGPSRLRERHARGAYAARRRPPLLLGATGDVPRRGRCAPRAAMESPPSGVRRGELGRLRRRRLLARGHGVAVAEHTRRPEHARLRLGTGTAVSAPRAPD